ncbi:serine protease [Nitrosomonas sp.]|uniref:S1 family peptidase n=1 Tax=Nitrosomonas sp. TaxID=42353 RepID=UPI00272FD85D|nr:serine protease [Nitrosomonas sp.]MDP1786066.1 serine protease [Nitrosomonas sp.]
MKKDEVCHKLKDVTYIINIYQGNELVSQGTGVCINERGDLLTAAHVLSGSLPVKTEDIKNLIILAKKEGGEFKSYSIVVCGLSISVSQLKSPVTFDLAVLRNSVEQVGIDYLEVCKKPLRMGEDILMVGYSDEVSLPFAFEENIDYKKAEFQGLQEVFKNALQSNMRFSMFKSGMVGRCYNVTFTDPKIGDITGFTFYIDNVMHSGSSGGPVVNTECKLVGIITQRAITPFSTENSPGMQVPSGSTIAVSAYSVLDYLEAVNCKSEAYVPWHPSTT